MNQSFERKKSFVVIIFAILLICTLAIAVACDNTNEYSLNFVTDGGTEIAPIKAEAGAEVSPPANPEKSGHTFGGWYLTEDFSGESVTLPTVMPDGDRTYYAKFIPVPTASLTLDPVDGTLEKTAYTVEVGALLSEVLEGIVPTLDGAVFGGWFDGNREIRPNAKMPANGLTLTARYKAEYSIVVFLQDELGEYGDPTDKISFEGGSDWLGETINLSTSVLRPPEGFSLDRVYTRAITLTAGENVYNVYFERSQNDIYYFDNAPADLEAEGEMSYQTVLYGAPHTILDCEYTVQGYRFAGWATEPEGAVVYAVGDVIESVENVTMLYARWNLGATDFGGGADRVYLLMEKPDAVVLFRNVLGEREGVYNPETRIFRFDIAQGKTIQGRMSEDGTRFAYFDSDMVTTLNQYDGTTVGGATITLDGLDSATYTQDGGNAVIGTYTRVSTMTYSFVSETHTFRFRLDSVDGQEVFWKSDGFEGTYYYYTDNVYYPIVILDGFGGARYLSNANAGVITGTYGILSGETDVVEVTYPNGDSQVSFVCKLGEENAASSTQGTVTVSVFYLADDTRGEYQLSTDGGQSVLKLDGFGVAMYGTGDGARTTEYSYNRNNGYYRVVEGVASYFGYAQLTIDGESLFALLNLTDMTATLVEHNTILSESNPRSGVNARLRIYDNQTAGIEVRMTNNRYQLVIAGTNIYDEASNFYSFTATWFAAATETVNFEEMLSGFYADIVYRLEGNAAFIIADGAQGRYEFVDAGSIFQLDCDGFGGATLSFPNAGGSLRVVYRYEEGYSNGTTTWAFIYFDLEGTQYTVRLDTATKSGYLISEYRDFGNRLPVEGELFAFTPVGDGKAFIRFPSEMGGYQVGVEGNYEVESFEAEIDGVKYIVYREFTFTATYYAEGFADMAGDYGSFVFRWYPSIGSAFCIYNEKETAEYTASDKLTIRLNGDGTGYYGNVLCAVQLDGQYIRFTAVSNGATGIVRLNGDDTVTVGGIERGTYFALDENGILTFDGYLLELDGFGGAELLRYVQSPAEGEESFVTVATGTYSSVDGETDYLEYEVSFDAASGFESFVFARGTTSLSGMTLNVYLVRDESRVAEYVIANNGGTLTVDAYGEATFSDVEGNKRVARIQKLDDTIIEGRKLLIVGILNAAGSGYDIARYVLVTENNQNVLYVLDGVEGVYRFLSGEIITNVQIVLDGLGNATIYNEDETVLSRGTYESVAGPNEWLFVSPDSEEMSFRFFVMFDRQSTDGQTYDLFLIYEEKWETELVSADWEAIMLNGYGYASFFDKLGRVYAVMYEIVDENTIRVYSNAIGEFWLIVDFKTGTFSYTTENPAA